MNDRIEVTCKRKLVSGRLKSPGGLLTLGLVLLMIWTGLAWPLNPIQADPLAQDLESAGHSIALPRPEPRQRPVRAAPGSDPDKPPILR